MKKKQVTISIPIEYEYLLSNLFGKSNYHAVTGSGDIKFLKKTLFRLFKSLSRSVQLNVVSGDEILMSEIEMLCDNALSELKQNQTAELLMLKMISYLTRICFQLIGQYPNNWSKRSTNLNKEWKLDKYRNVVYTSNFQQKSFLILDNYSRFASSTTHPKVEVLWDKLNYDFNNDYLKFIKWFKKEYNDIYKCII